MTPLRTPQVASDGNSAWTCFIQKATLLAPGAQWRKGRASELAGFKGWVSTGTARFFSLPTLKIGFILSFRKRPGTCSRLRSFQMKNLCPLSLHWRCLQGTWFLSQGPAWTNHGGGGRQCCAWISQGQGTAQWACVGAWEEIANSCPSVPTSLSVLMIWRKLASKAPAPGLLSRVTDLLEDTWGKTLASLFLWHFRFSMSNLAHSFLAHCSCRWLHPGFGAIPAPLAPRALTAPLLLQAHGSPLQPPVHADGHCCGLLLSPPPKLE